MIALDQPYSLELFHTLMSSLGGDFYCVVDKSSLVHQKYWKHISGVQRIGEIGELDISCFVITHNSSHDPRISLTKETFRVLSSLGVRQAIIAFHNLENPSWRLSLVTMDLALTDKNTVEKTYSNAKRFSFLLGPGEKVKTPEQQLKTRITSLVDLKSRFSVEVVRKQFFDDYIDLFIRLYRAISEDTHFTHLLKQQGVNQVKFTKNLLGKIVFVYFIQKKGWLGIGRDGTWGKGDKNFMRTLWNRFDSEDTFVKPSTEYFYNDYLEHLFYNGFNKDRRDDDGYEPNMRMKVPFLNGGLFKEDYVGWEDFTAKIPNTIFSNGKDGILDIFDTYNFTIDEDDQTDAEVAVDPEMLGKIFEKMISVSHENIDEILQIYGEKGKIKIGKELNKKFGAFYTPREIVHYMTRESLIAYLATNLVGKKEDNEVKIRTLIELKDQHRSRQELENSLSLASIATSVDELLQKVKIIDPAVGSGAFPMGILHEISTLRYYLHSEGFCTVHSDHSEEEGDTTELTIDGHLSMYQIKRETIKNSIYGVDIEPGAIDIARLRFWLSLVVDAEHPEPLPNFEFKFVCANTLIPLDEDIGQKQMTFGMLEEASLKTIKRYKREYYNADTKNEKARIAMKLREYTKLPALRLGDIVPRRSLQIDEFGKNFDNSNYSHSFFDASLMLSEWRGFDIVIGNPPYKFLSGKGSPVKELEKKGKKQEALVLQSQLNILSQIFSKSSEGCKDYYKWFIEKGLLLAQKKGFLCYITPNTFISLAQYMDVRRLLFEENNTDILIDLGFDIFEDPVVPTAIFLTKKSIQNTNIFSYSDLKDLSYADIVGKNIEEIRKETALSVTVKEGSLKIYKHPLAEKIYDDTNFTSLKKILKIKEGDHCNIPDFNNAPDLEGRMPFVNDNLLNRYSYVPIVFLDTNEYSYVPDFHTGDRILIRKTGDSIVSSLPNDFLPGITHQNCYVCKMITDDKIKFVYALLCSKLLNFLYQNGPYGQKGRTLAQFRVYGLNLLPIKIPENQSTFTTLVDQILEAKKLDTKADTSDLEKQIDSLVYELYGLTGEEITVVEGK